MFRCRPPFAEDSPASWRESVRAAGRPSGGVLGDQQQAGIIGDLVVVFGADAGVGVVHVDVVRRLEDGPARMVGRLATSIGKNAEELGEAAAAGLLQIMIPGMRGGKP